MEHWKHWTWNQELELYLVATEKDKMENKVKSSILLPCIGPQGREIYNMLAFSQKREQNITLLRYKFLTYQQKEGQNFDKFMAQLKKLSSDCEFGELKKSLIKACVHYFLSNLYFSLNDSPSKTMKNVFYFI